jgi:hypothetical protein
MVNLAPYTRDVIVGLVLSDGNLSLPNPHSKSARLGLQQSGHHYKYLWFVFFILAHYCSSFPHSIKRSINVNQFFFSTICYSINALSQ